MWGDANEVQRANESRRIVLSVDEDGSAEDGGVRRLDVQHALRDTLGRQVTGSIDEDSGLVG
jgi:hypothetical protein